MTIPAERTRAVLLARKLLFELLNPKFTPHVPLAVRQRAGQCLRHFPFPSDIEEAFAPGCCGAKLKR